MDGREPATEAPWCALCPEAALGAVVGDVARRGGQVLGLDVRDADDRVIHAEVPLARVFGYAGALSGLTHGRGRFTLEPLRYEPVPDARLGELARGMTEGRRVCGGLVRHFRPRAAVVTGRSAA